MGSLIGLIRAVVAPQEVSDDQARSLVSLARAQSTDVLILIAHRFAIDEERVFERAARFLGLPFFNAIPSEPPGVDTRPIARQVDDIATMRHLPSYVFDRLVVFMAPTAEEMIALAQRRRHDAESLGDICVVPPRVLRATLRSRMEEDLLSNARQRLARRWPIASAHLELPLITRSAFVALVCVFMFVVAFAPFNLAPVAVLLMLAIFIPNAWLRLAAIFETPDMIRARESTLLRDHELPIYSVMVPLRDEAQMVPQLAEALLALDYPSEKLDIKFVVESVSTETITAVQNYLHVPQFELIEVPEGPPHTKPKAINYALPMARGEHIVVFDAEDIPEPSQLRRAATAFANNPGTDCLQAELRVENATDSWLSALFASEYSGLFGVMLPALARWRLPIPLSGTSNHFRMEALKAVGGWDAFNVTEDADLGVRLARLRYRVQTLPAQTLEEAPVTIRAWLGQRTRWMKGWMQTFVVHNRHPIALFKDMGWRNFLAFEYFVGGMVLSAPLHLVFVLALVVRLTLEGALGLELDGHVGFAHLFLFVAGYVGSGSLSVVGAMRLNKPRLLVYQLLLPLYWALIGVAAFRAGYELISRPFFWEKTKHGVSRAKT